MGYIPILLSKFTSCWAAQVLDHFRKHISIHILQGLSSHPGASAVKNLPAMQMRFDPWVGKIHWSRKVLFWTANHRLGLPRCLVVKNSPANARNTGWIPGSGTSLEKERQPAPVFLPGKSHGHRSLAGYSPQGCKRVGHDFLTKQQLKTWRACISNL